MVTEQQTVSRRCVIHTLDQVAAEALEAAQRPAPLPQTDLPIVVGAPTGLALATSCAYQRRPHALHFVSRLRERQLAKQSFVCGLLELHLRDHVERVFGGRHEVTVAQVIELHRAAEQWLTDQTSWLPLCIDVGEHLADRRCRSADFEARTAEHLRAVLAERRRRAPGNPGKYVTTHPRHIRGPNARAGRFAIGRLAGLAHA